MVKHIVLWKLREHAEGRTKTENAEKAKQMFEALNGKIPGLIKMEIGVDISRSNTSSDLSLYSEFESEDDLSRYLTNPEHLAVVPFMAAVRSEHRVVNYL